jgi:hypothetical protein
MSLEHLRIVKNKKVVKRGWELFKRKRELTQYWNNLSKKSAVLSFNPYDKRNIHETILV